MVDEATYNELDRYFTGRMQGDERAAFEQRLSSDAHLKTELDWIVNATAAMKNSGRMVMKQHIAAAIAGIPAKELQQYKPAKNAKPFWKKWWVWIVAAAVVVAVSAAVIYANVPTETFDHSEEEHSQATDALMDPAAGEQTPVDSFREKMKLDSVRAESFDDAAVDEKVVVSPRNDQAKFYEVDSAVTNAPVYLSKVAHDEVQKDQRMNTRINLRRQPPYAYFLDDNLTLYANYSSTAGFTFRGSGDTIYMTDNNAQVFMLLRGKGEQPLVPVTRQ